jgi:hypothetical protein
MLHIYNITFTIKLLQKFQTGTCILFYSAVSEDRNAIKKEVEKILKYKDLTINKQVVIWRLGSAQGQFPQAQKIKK